MASDKTRNYLFGLITKYVGSAWAAHTVSVVMRSISFPSRGRGPSLLKSECSLLHRAPVDSAWACPGLAASTRNKFGLLSTVGWGSSEAFDVSGSPRFGEVGRLPFSQKFLVFCCTVGYCGQTWKILGTAYEDITGFFWVSSRTFPLYSAWYVVEVGSSEKCFAHTWSVGCKTLSALRITHRHLSKPSCLCEALKIDAHSVKSYNSIYYGQ